MSDHWSVRVECGGEEVVTIESNCLSGREIGLAEDQAIRNCAYHLLSFIGDPHQTRGEAGWNSAIRKLRDYANMGLSAIDRDGASRAARYLESISPGPIDEESRGNWLPIETAPKDGYEILITNSGIGMVVRIAFWDNARGGGWRVWPGREEPIHAPSHWMPLPTSPRFK